MAIELRSLTRRLRTGSPSTTSPHCRDRELLVAGRRLGLGQDDDAPPREPVDRADECRVWIDGVDNAHGAAPLLRRRIGYCFQQVGLFPHMTVARTSRSRRPCSAGARPSVAARVDELLARVALDRPPTAIASG